MVIFKYKIDPVEGAQVMMLPKMIQVVHAGVDGVGNYCFWARVDPTSKSVKKKVRMLATGERFTSDWIYAFTWHDSELVWHLALHKDFYLDGEFAK